MNSRWSRGGTGGRLTLALLAILWLACGGGDTDGKKPAKPPADPLQADAEELGHDLFDTVDRIMAYRSAHQNKLPTSLRQAGIDSLARTTVRRYAKSGSTPVVTVAFRRSGGHQLTRCQGTSDVLEDASLHEGAFTISCTLVEGSTRGFSVGGRPAE